MSHITVIGAGPAGIAATQEAARLGADVTLIESDHVGGRATWHSLVPSKVWLTAAAHGEASDIEALQERIAATSKHMTGFYADTFPNVKVIQGTAALNGTHSVTVNDETLDADAVIIATGSGPVFPEKIKPDGKRIIAPRFMSKLPALPRSLIMIGGGVTGVEYAGMFSALGIDVTLVTDLDRLLPMMDRDISTRLEETMVGITIMKNSPVEAVTATENNATVTLQSGETLQAEMAFIALGRRVFTQGLNLEAAGLTGGLTVDGYGRTAVTGIYAVGDVAGVPMTANKATAQGYIAARHALDQPVKPYNHHTVIDAVYTTPEVAQVGLNEQNAGDRPLQVICRTYDGNLKAKLIDGTEGMLKLLVDPETKALLGGAAVGVHAGDVLAPLAVALSYNGTLSELAAIFSAHPTLSEVLFDAARNP